MPITATTCGQTGEHGMAQAGENSSAIAAIVQGIFLESLRQPILRRRADRQNAKIGAKSPRVANDPLIPLRRGVRKLVDAGCDRSAGNRVRAVRFKQVIVLLRFLCWTDVR